MTTCKHTEYHLPGKQICNDCMARDPDCHSDTNQGNSAKTREMYDKESKMGSRYDHKEAINK